MMAGFTEAMGNQSVANSESADALLAKAQMEVAASNPGMAAPVGQQATEAAGVQQNQAAAMPAGGDDILNRLNNL